MSGIATLCYKIEEKLSSIEGEPDYYAVLEVERRATQEQIKASYRDLARTYHPDLHVGWGRCGVEIWTHKIDGLTDSDFYLAAKADRAFTESR